ncbi:gas vesicle protein GvpG [Glycomyces sp. NPDC049804]|uniref:gas vesicle protein GvpG n=1 Tax=Glycomyces sp. NPDC049804 TaxID=3154363 RepID=UPI003412C824
MNLVSMILQLPLLPLRGVVAVADIIREQAERELYDPSRVRQQIEETDAAVEAGELTEEEASQRHEEILEPVAEPAVGVEQDAETSSRRGE